MKKKEEKLNRDIQRQWMVDEREDSKIGLKLNGSFDYTGCSNMTIVMKIICM